MPLTVLAALEAVFPVLSIRETVKLHFMGAATRELTSLVVFEGLLHLLPSLKQLELTFVGLGLPAKQSTESDFATLDCCPECTSKGRTRSLRLWKGAYHDYIKKGVYGKPDLAVAFHTGFSREMQMEWLPTIKHVATAPHPTLFTPYNDSELREEIEILENLGARLSKAGGLNKWRGMTPVLDVAAEKPNKAYFSNYYWYIVAGGA
jgi:splicing suppressor protein 51